MIYSRTNLASIFTFGFLYLIGCTEASWAAPKVIKGYKFFGSDSDAKEFRVKGVAYYPRPNGGDLNVNSVDFFTDEYEKVWKPDLQRFKQLGINTIRVYAVDPTQSHDKFMCELSKLGIYVIVDMSAVCEGCSIPAEAPPKCYPPELLTRAQMIYNAFAVYDNVLAFSVGNENNYDEGVSAPCVKAFLRDVREYANSCSNTLRDVPVGLVHADKLPRAQWVDYYDCVMDNNENTRAQWTGWNQYVECDPKTHTQLSQSSGYKELMGDFQDIGYSQPVIFTEFGCNEVVNTLNGTEQQRNFYDAKWMNEEPELMDIASGGLAFEYSVEASNAKKSVFPFKTADPGRFGIGYFSPEKCDHVNTPCIYNQMPEFANLAKAFTSTKESSVTASAFESKRNTARKCPAKFPSGPLPSKPSVKNLACAVRQPVCDGAKPAGKKVNSAKKGGNDSSAADGLSIGTSVLIATVSVLLASIPLMA